MNKSINALKHLESKDIQIQIRSYASCPHFTSEGKLCRSSFSTNKFIDPVTKKASNCNWYCLRQCSPKKLIPMFHNLPKLGFTTNGKTAEVTDIHFDFMFGKKILFKIMLFHDIRPSDPIEWEWIDYTKLPEDAERRNRGSDLNTLANEVCQWFKKQSPNIEMILDCSVVFLSSNSFDARHFSHFDIPFLRPVSEWEWEGSSTTISVKFALSSSSVPISVFPITTSTEEKISDDSSSIPWETLPIGLAEKEQLIYHGVAHPDIHRIPRRQREASRYRPRHFHSPIRKEVVGRSMRQK
jgi:hypothetical protein